MQPISLGWNNQNYNNLEMTLLSKIIAIQYEEIPFYVQDQINRFLDIGVRGPNLFVLSNGVSNTCRTIMQELRELFNR